MARRDPFLEFFKPVLWLVVASFLIGFTGVLALAGAGAIGGHNERTELASAMEAAETALHDS